MTPRRALLLLVLVLPVLLQAASLPHTHGGASDGLFNQEHDLTLLAMLAAGASQGAAASPALVFILVVVALVTLAPSAPVVAAPGDADSRAPPAR